MEACESWRAEWKIPCSNLKSWTAKGNFQTMIFSDSTCINAGSSSIYLAKKPERFLLFCSNVKVLLLCPDLCLDTWGKERNKRPQTNLDCHKGPVKSHFSFPFLMERGAKAWRMCCSPSEQFPLPALAGLEWAVWALPLFWLVAPTWHSIYPNCWSRCCYRLL